MLRPPLAISPFGTPITIRDVARAAGVSVATVSKALNDQGRMRPHTRDHIQQIARQLGFRPNDLATSLHRKRSFTVGLLSNDFYGRFSMPILGGIEAALAERRVSVFLCNAADNPESEQRHLDSLISKRVDGLILTARRTDHRFAIRASAIGLPVLHVLARGEEAEAEAPALLPDDEGGGRLATSHLARLGRQRIAHVTGPEHFEAVRLRRAGYRAALAEHGLGLDPGLEMIGSWSEAWGHAAAAALFGPGRANPDAVFCGSDQIARGMADGLREQGLAVPGDVALVGYDNWEIIAAATRPALTTIDANLTEIGRLAGAGLIDMIEGKAGPSGIERVAGRLVVRASCGGGTPPH